MLLLRDTARVEVAGSVSSILHSAVPCLAGNVFRALSWGALTSPLFTLTGAGHTVT